jgi:release factor glutamine methyltransferase
MNQRFSEDLLARLENNLDFLPDKPEETAVTTLAALWLTAAGEPTSAVAAVDRVLPALDRHQQASLKDLVDRRLTGTPLAHITGRQQFMGIELLTTAQALIPRKETEILGLAAVRLLEEIEKKTKNPMVMDVCTGAGNLAVVMALRCPSCRVYASDLSNDAVALARENVVFREISDRVKVRVGDLFAAFNEQKFQGSMDLITCNPPYISTNRVSEMDGEISGHEPSLAFDGGAFGIKILHRLIKEAPRYTKRAGWLAFEVGLGQGEAMIKRMKKKYSYTEVTPLTDDNGEIRGIIARNGGMK